MINYKKLHILLLLGIFSISTLLAQNIESRGHDCFSVLVGNKATEDGSVMFAHNEDDFGERIVNWYKVPSLTHRAGTMVTMKNGGGLPQVKQTNAYIWLEMPEMEFSDSYMNEWGVTISSDACLSKEKKGELTEGGIGYWLRRAMIERAKTAREAVKIGGALVEQYGYTSSGRTYCIAGPREAWMLAVVNGKQWVAQRVPDDHIAIIPNYYTITTIDLADTINFYGSADLIEYATKKKWYNSKKDPEFNFREVYGDPKTLENMGNLVRHWSALNMLSGEEYDIEEEFPFSFKPHKPVPMTVLFEVLRDHSEGTEYDKTENYKLGNPHEHGKAICSQTTQYGFVAQLRSQMPKEYGNVMWIAPFRPCIHPFTQWYVGMDEMPPNFAIGEFRYALDSHFEAIENMPKYAKEHNFLKYVKHAQAVDRTYGKQIKLIKPKVLALELELLKNQKSFENSLEKFNAADKRQSANMMLEYVNTQVEKSLLMLEK